MEKIFFLSTNIFRGPPRGVNPKKNGISKFLEYYVVGSLNLCLKKPDSLQKESAQSDHPAKRKRTICGPILLFWANVKISQYLCTFRTFSLGGVIGLS